MLEGDWSFGKKSAIKGLGSEWDGGRKGCSFKWVCVCVGGVRIGLVEGDIEEEEGTAHAGLPCKAYGRTSQQREPSAQAPRYNAWLVGGSPGRTSVARTK